MPSSSSATACSTPTNDSMEKIIKNDAVRYQRKGYGLISAFIISASFFYFTPKIFELFWPFVLKNMSSNAIFFFGGNGFHTGVHIIGNLIMYCIYKGKFPFFERYRISNKPWPWESDPAQWKHLLKKTFMILALCHIVITPLLTIMDLNSGVKMRLDMESFPSVLEVILHICFFMVCEDFFFYWSHRLLHHPRIYPYIHKVHHEYNTTVSIASEYVHPVEFIFGNILPTNSGPKILGHRTHFVTYCIWMIIRIMETTDGHSGYEFSWSPYRLLPLSGSSIYHNFHHSHNVGNYGSFFTLWDTLCGTNKHFFKYLADRERKQLNDQLSPEYNKLKERISKAPDTQLAKRLEKNID